ncbi:MAG: type I 3-dehydroquinate dehydratase [Chitinivibrionales bacterium]
MTDRSVQIGSCDLGTKPHIVVSIDREMSSDVLSSLSGRGASLIEMRVDCFHETVEKTVRCIERVRELSGLPLIGTIRENRRTESVRLDLFRNIIPVVDAIDIEIDTEINSEVIALAQSTTVIVSEHDFEKTPDGHSLHNVVNTAMAQGADIVKIATMAQSRQDVSRLLRFTQDVQAPVVTMAMGELGAISRVTAPLFGSLFTYSFVADSVAPGQIPLDELAAYMARFYPEVR